jgi:hypothetical protein
MCFIMYIVLGLWLFSGVSFCVLLCGVLCVDCVLILASAIITVHSYLWCVVVVAVGNGLNVSTGMFRV